jgi:enamine deaminase RidA (YjgF/YER057c/UK114 family)
MQAPTRETLIARLRELGAELPTPETTIYDYVPLKVHDRIAYLAGQIPKKSGGLTAVGLAGGEVSLDDAKIAARTCIEQALAWIDSRAGGIENVEQVLRLDCYVAAADGFRDISDIADAASGLLVGLYGNAGRHPRSVIGVSQLPRMVPVLIELTVALRRAPPQDAG